MSLLDRWWTGFPALAVLSLGGWILGTPPRSLRGEELTSVVETLRLSEVAPAPVAVPEVQAGEIQAALDRGVAFLLATQHPRGWWGSATRTKDLNIYAPTPGAHHAFRAGVTALCVAALVDIQSDKPEIADAINRGEAWLLEYLPKLRRANADAIYNVWGHAYGIEALARLHPYRAGDPAKQARLIQEIEHQAELLGRYESVNGGWGYYDFTIHSQKPATEPTSFTTATVLFAFHQARQIGAKIPERLVQRGLEVIQRQQRPDLGYLYSENFHFNPGRDINKPGGSVGRSQACNLVLRLYGDPSVSDAALKAWADRLFSRNLWLDIGRKRPIPHESWFQVAGYFFYYGHYYAAFCLEHLPENERGPLRQQLAHVMLRLQEKDGSWWDYPFYNYHQPYGTAFALMTLKRCVPSAE